eukprot:1268678-Pyramimonas_sp.AAC.1
MKYGDADVELHAGFRAIPIANASAVLIRPWLTHRLRLRQGPLRDAELAFLCLACAAPSLAARLSANFLSAQGKLC